MPPTPTALDNQRARIVVDSSSNVPPTLLAEYKMLEVPTLVNFGTESLRNNVDLSSEVFYARFAQSTQLPTTSQPPPPFFVAAYQQAFAEGAEHILVITVSHKFSGTFASAQTATQEFPEALAAGRFTLWDSASASIGSGWQALVAARMLEQGVELATLLARLEQIRASTVGYVTLETLKYAARSGRVSNLQAGIGDLLQVKPVMEVIQGRFAPVGRFHASVGNRPVNLAVAHANTPNEAAELAAEVRNTLKIQELYTVDIGPAIATLTGPGTIALLGHPVDE
jgi:DegV family protein with EDD domain